MKKNKESCMLDRLQKEMREVEMKEKIKSEIKSEDLSHLYSVRVH